MKTTLEAKIEARNLANSEHNRLLPALKEAFRPLVGKKICKADGYLMEKYKHLAPVNPNTPRLSIYKRVSDYSLDFVVKTCIPCGECGCTYDEVTMCVGKLTDGVLTEICGDYPPLRTDFTKDEVLMARHDVKEAQKALSLAQSRLNGFGEYDR